MAAHMYSPLARSRRFFVVSEDGATREEWKPLKHNTETVLATDFEELLKLAAADAGLESGAVSIRSRFLNHPDTEGTGGDREDRIFRIETAVSWVHHERTYEVEALPLPGTAGNWPPHETEGTGGNTGGGTESTVKHEPPERSAEHQAAAERGIFVPSYETDAGGSGGESHETAAKSSDQENAEWAGGISSNESAEAVSIMKIKEEEVSRFHANFERLLEIESSNRWGEAIDFVKSSPWDFLSQETHNATVMLILAQGFFIRRSFTKAEKYFKGAIKIMEENIIGNRGWSQYTDFMERVERVWGFIRDRLNVDACIYRILKCHESLRQSIADGLDEQAWRRRGKELLVAARRKPELLPSHEIQYNGGSRDIVDAYGWRYQKVFEASITSHNDDLTDALTIVEDSQHLFPAEWEILPTAKALARGPWDKIPILVTIREDSLDYFTALLTKGLYTQRKVIDRDVALMVAVKGKCVDVAELLLMSNTGPNENDGILLRSPLAEALINKHLQMAQMLLDFGANTDTKGLFTHYDDRYHTNGVSTRWTTPLLYAVASGKEAMIEILLKHGASAVLDFTEDAAPYEPDRARYAELLFEAVSHDHYRTVSLLCSQDIDVNAKNSRGDTALHVAVRAGHTESSGILCKRGADVRAEDSNGNSILHAVALGSVKGRYNPPNERFSHEISSNPYLKILALLSRVKVDQVERRMLYDARNLKGQTALHIAAGGNIPLVSCLIANGANLVVRDNEGMNPLHYAAILGQDAILKSFCATRGDVNAKDYSGRTALYLAATHGNANCAKILIKHKADIYAADDHWMTPFDEASRKGYVAVMRVFYEEGAVIDSPINPNGSTALHLAAWNGHADMVRFLCRKGACIEARNTYGYTPLWSAVKNCQESAVEALLEEGADVNSVVGGEGWGKMTPLHLIPKLPRPEGLRIWKILLDYGGKMYDSLSFESTRGAHFWEHEYDPTTEKIPSQTLP